MRSLNQCNFIGYLGGDVESRHMPNGNEVANFTIAVADDYTKDGNKVEQTEWVRVVAFNKLAGICSQYLQKGSRVFISGKFKTRSYEQDGVKKYATEVVANEMQMLDSRNAQDSTQKPASTEGNGQDAAQNFDNFSDESDPPF